MQLCSERVNVHGRDDVYAEGETVQAMTVNAAGTILAVLTQLHLHFWSAGPRTVYLTSLQIPNTSLEENPALFVMWRQRLSNHLAVVTTREVVFFEADINLQQADFLQTAERRRYSVFLHHVDSASRVCYSSRLHIEAGLATSAVAAGPYAFLVTTTAGMVYVVGWNQQLILHQWSTVGLQEGGHTFKVSTTNTTATSAEAQSAKSPSTGGRTGDSFAQSPIGLARPSTTSLTSWRVDPLQRRYTQDARGQHGDASPFLSSTVSVQNLSTAANPASSSPFAVANIPWNGSVSSGIRPPGAAVRGRPSDAVPAPTTNVAVTQFSNAGEVAVVENEAGIAPPVKTASPTPTEGEESTGSPSVVEQAKQERGSPSPAAQARAVSVDMAVNVAADRFGHSLSTGAITNGMDQGGADAIPSPSGRSAGADQLSGTILHASFLSKWKMLSFVFSSGAVLLCRPSCGTNFTHSTVQLHGCVTPLVSVSMVAMNMRHLLLAVSTPAGAISCRRVDGTTLAISLAPLWKGLRGVLDMASGYGTYGDWSRSSSGLAGGGGRRGSDAASPLATSSSASQSLGLISAMEWSPSEELLCVAFYKLGMVLVHYSGGVVTHHLAGPAAAMLLRSPSVTAADIKDVAVTTLLTPIPSASTKPLGCTSVAWRADGTRLWMVAPGQTCFFSVQLSRVLIAETVGPTGGHHTPLALLSDSALYLVAVSEATIRHGVSGAVLLPDAYMQDAFPLLYGAVSATGRWIACAGRRGVVLFNRDRYSWKLASQKSEEFAVSCVADPVWLRDIAVAVPALRTDTKTYELLVLSTNSVSPSHALSRVALEGRPTAVSAVHQDHRGEGYVVVVDANQVVRVFRYDAFTDESTSSSSPSAGGKPYISLSPIQQLVLTGDLTSPLQVLPVCLRGAEDDRENPQRTHGQPELRLLMHRRCDHSLVWLRGDRVAPAAAEGASSNAHLLLNGSLPLLKATADPLYPSEPAAFVYGCWIDRTPPVRGVVLLTNEERGGLVLYQLLHGDGAERGGSVTARRMEVTSTKEAELLPIGVSPFDGYALCIATDSSAPRSSRRAAAAEFSRAGPHPQLVLRPILYAHRVLSVLLRSALPAAPQPPVALAKPLPLSSDTPPVEATMRGSVEEPTVAEVDGRVATFFWDRALFLWLEQMRLNDTFVLAMDYFLHTALNDSPPAGVPGLGRRSAIRAVIVLLRNYPEFYAIVVGCVRKMDFTRWPLVLDFLGTPTSLFRDCLAHHCYAEAVHLVRVIMMGSYRPVSTLSVARVAELRMLKGDGSVGPHTTKPNDALTQASECAVELFGVSVENGDYNAAYDLLRFMALIEEEIGMPAVAGGDGAGGAGGAANTAGPEGFLARWLRQLTFSGAAYDDPEAAVEENAEMQHGVNGGGDVKVVAPDLAARQALRGMIDRYPTLVLDAARCDSSKDGISAADAADETQRQSAVRQMFHRHPGLPAVVHEESLRLLRTGYVTQLAKLTDTFSFSVPRFLQAAGTLLNLRAVADRDAACEAETGMMLRLDEVFDGLHKELGLPRSFHVPGPVVAATAWNTWLREQQAAQAARLPGVLNTTNPQVWSVAQSALYATPHLLKSVDTLHQLFRHIFVYNLAFCVLLMRKVDLLALLLSPAAAGASSAETDTDAVDAEVAAATVIERLGHLEALLAIPENAGYKPFLQDVFQSLPPSVLRSHVQPILVATAPATLVPPTEEVSTS